jgi:hypothetical protein
VGSELALSEALRVTMIEDVAQTIERAESYTVCATATWSAIRP